MQLRFVIPGLPISWKREQEIHWVSTPRIGKNAMRVVGTRGLRAPRIGKTAKAKKWMRAAVKALAAQYGKEPISGLIIAYFVIYQGKGQSIDANNATQGAFDALEKAGILTNDYNIEDFRARRTRDRENPRIEIVLGSLGPMARQGQ